MCMVMLTRVSTRGAGRTAHVVACIVYTTSIIHKSLQGVCWSSRHARRPATWPECILLYSIFQKSPRIVLVRRFLKIMQTMHNVLNLVLVCNGKVRDVGFFLFTKLCYIPTRHFTNPTSLLATSNHAMRSYTPYYKTLKASPFVPKCIFGDYLCCL